MGIIQSLLYHIGRYALLQKKVFGRIDKWSVFKKQIFIEMENLCLDSLGIVAIISVFMGAVLVIQTAYNIDSPFIPLYTIGFTTRQSLVLEFCPTIVSLILAGKVGSRISSEIGTMRVTEQIDALEIMGVNSSSYLILPKIVACVILNPFLIALSMLLGLLGGWGVALFGSAVTPHVYLLGIQSFFVPFEIFYALIKTAFFALIITSVSGYHGYYTHGGALEVGQSSTKAVVYSSILIILSNLVLTQLLLSK
ncbi:MAG TPA: ABC transporter permease [Bacteroidales bacterium]|nr:ABC transporter permease [Bacteroidales bacterium]HPS15861.1 ABC transporter permease [Bacteroidales bacterium]